LENPSVLGVGIGSSEDNSGEGVVVVILERGKTATIPALLEGIRTRVVYGEAIHALGIRGSQEMNQ
jgi:hypothetical protein